MVSNITEIKECPDCAYPELIYNESKQQVVCKSCGLIYEPLTPKEEESYLGYLGLAGAGKKLTVLSSKSKKAAGRKVKKSKKGFRKSKRGISAS